MPDVLAIKSTDWELVIWTRDQGAKERLFSRTISARGAPRSMYTEVRFYPALTLREVEVAGEPRFLIGEDSTTQFQLDFPVLFENTLYEFEFTFTGSISGAPEIQHKLSRIQEAFRYKASQKSLRGTVNLGNDVGWLKLPLVYSINGKQRKVSISVEVFPTKMDMATDLEVIYQKVDSQYPLWRFALAEQTELEFDREPSRHQKFPLLWLAQFESLQAELWDGVRHIIRSPHNRLVTETRMVSAARMKGRISNKLAEQIRGDLAVGLCERRYSISRKKLSVNTAENRFIKMVLEKTRDSLARFIEVARASDRTPDNNRLSPAFYQTMSEWRRHTEIQLANPLFGDVGEYSGMTSESLVLQQKAGYAAVYRCWQKLKMYLGVLGSQSSISMKSVSELYEVWCFLEIKDLLIDMGFEQVKTKRTIMRDNGLEKSISDGFFGAFELFRSSDKVSIRLAHEPIFNAKTKPISALITTQKPDILLEVKFPKGDKFIWLFDAKYRIKDDDREEDYVPDDAINQMHRYRDALLISHEEGGIEGKSRPVFGAFSLYPGFFIQSRPNNNQNPYADAIDKVGIGAFPLLPSQIDSSGNDDSGRAWLRIFLEKKLNRYDLAVPENPDDFYIEDSSRIPVYGMSQRRYPDLTMVVTGAPIKGRLPDYIESFRQGSARWYHMRLLASERKNIQQHLMKEIRYCVISSFEPSTRIRHAEWVWPVESVSLVPRYNLTKEQTGKPEIEDDSLYWLLKLSAPRRLSVPLKGFPAQGHHLKLCGLTVVDRVGNFSKVEGVYSNVKIS